jgi:hypothetical protein
VSFVVAGMGTGDQPFAWASRDGLRWTDESAQLPFEAPPWQLAWTGAEFLALGRGETTAAFASTDGSRWKRVPGPPVPAAFAEAPQVGMSPISLLATEQDTLALYQTDDGSTTSIWRRKADGSWVGLPLDGFDPQDQVSGGTTIAGQFYLFVGRAGDGVILRSRDGSTWTDIGRFPSRTVGALAAFGGRAVLVASLPGEDRDQSQVFVADASTIR